MNQKASDLTQLARAPARDPQVSGVPLPKSHWRTRLLLPGLILLATAVLLSYAAREALLPATSVRVAPVMVKTDVSTAVQGTVLVQAPGWVEADPFPSAVSALADGVVSEVLVLEGARVDPAQIVARLVDDDARLALDHAKAMLGERQAALSVARAKLEEAEQNWKHPVELTRKLHTAEASLAKQRAELARWPYELAREEAQVVYLKAELDRLTALTQDGSAANIELIRARQDHEAQRAEVEAIRKREAILQAQIRAPEAEVAAATENLKLRITDTRALAEARAALQRAEAAVASAEAMRAEAALRLQRMEVRAPVGGVVMTRLAEPGSKLMLNMDNPRSAQVVRLYDPAKLQVRVDIPLVEAAKVGVGQPAEVIVEVLPNRVYGGRITRVVHEADVQKNTLQVKVAIEDPTPELKPEMLARARFLATADVSATGADGAAEQIFVPRSAVFERAGGTYVWLADQVAKRARCQPVTLGQAVVDDWVAVTEGARPGDRIILDAPAELTDGQRIRLVED